MNDVRELPTQVRRPWRAVARTIFSAIVAFGPLVPFIPDIVRASGAEQTAFGTAALALHGLVTRLMAIKAVNEWFRRFVPFLSAQGKAPTDLLR